METILQIKAKINYGTVMLYPDNELATKFVNLLNKKTFNDTDLDRIEKIGFVINITK